MLTRADLGLLVVAVMIAGALVVLYVLPAAWRWVVYGVDNTELVEPLDAGGNDVRSALRSVREVSRG